MNAEIEEKSKCGGGAIKRSLPILAGDLQDSGQLACWVLVLGDISVLIFETILKPDQFGGIGLFSATLLPKGTLIWIHNPIVDIAVTPEQYEALPPTFQALLDKHAYPRDLDVDDGVLEYNADNARFMNHSSQPNTYQDDHCRLFTTRDVQPGEELTCDYLSFDPRCDLSWVKEPAPNLGAGRRQAAAD